VDRFVSVVMPAYNEEKNIADAVKDVRDALNRSGWKHEIIVVDDGSRDGTAEAASKLDVKLLGNEVNMGKGAATRKGIRAARGDYIAIQDSDLTIPADTIPTMLEKLEREGWDAVYASRLAGTYEKDAMPYYRVFGNRVFAFILRLMTGQKLSDTLSGQKVFKSRIFSGMELVENGWPDFEILMKSARLGFRTGEVPVKYFKRREGSSKMRVLNHGFWFCTQLLKWYVRA